MYMCIRIVYLYMTYIRMRPGRASRHPRFLRVGDRASAPKGNNNNKTNIDNHSKNINDHNHTNSNSSNANDSNTTHDDTNSSSNSS